MFHEIVAFESMHDVLELSLRKGKTIAGVLLLEFKLVLYTSKYARMLQGIEETPGFSSIA